MLPQLTQAGIRLGALYLRHTPFEFGRWRLNSILLPMLRRIGPHMGRCTVRCRHGFRFIADLGDWLGQQIYLKGVYERPTADIFARLIKLGDNVLDVGANAGYFTVLASHLSGSSGRVLAFEPVPGVRAQLRANLELNHMHNVTLHETVVSNQNGVVTLYEGPQGHKGLSSLRPLDDAAQALTVRAVRLDDLADTPAKISFVKIDVEGAELMVLQGMSRIIERDHPYLVIEFTDSYLQSFGASATLLADWLWNAGYELFRISEQGLIPINAIGAQLAFQFNALCIPSGKFPPALQEKLRNG